LKKTAAKSKMGVMEYLGYALVGFVVGWATYICIGRNAIRFPGGSLASGILFANHDGVSMIAGAILGLSGWVLFALCIVVIEKFHVNQE